MTMSGGRSSAMAASLGVACAVDREPACRVLCDELSEDAVVFDKKGAHVSRVDRSVI